MSSVLVNDSSKDTVIFINDWSPHFVSALEKLSQRLDRPLRGIMLIDAERKSSGNYTPDKQNAFEEIVVDFSDDSALRRAMKLLEKRLLIVYCDSEGSQLYFKQVIPHVPYVNTPTEGSIVFSTDKGKMRELLRSYDEMSSPKAIVVKEASLETTKKLSAELRFPLIIKPTNLYASLLVNRVNTEDELRYTLEKNFTFLDNFYSKNNKLGDRTMIVEEFIEGELYSTDAYVDALGNVYVLPFIHFENGSKAGMDSYQIYQSETYHTLSTEDENEAIKVTEKAIYALGLRSTTAHIELFHTTGGWKVIELGARAGGRRQEMYKISYDIDHTLNGLLNKLGIAPDMPQSPIKTYVKTFNIHAPKAGTIDSITGVEEARRHPNMYAIYVNPKPGDAVLPSNQGGLEIVGATMCSTDHEQLNRDVDSIRMSIGVNIEENNAGKLLVKK